MDIKSISTQSALPPNSAEVGGAQNENISNVNPALPTRRQLTIEELALKAKKERAWLGRTSPPPDIRSSIIPPVPVRKTDESNDEENFSSKLVTVTSPTAQVSTWSDQSSSNSGQDEREGLLFAASVSGLKKKVSRDFEQLPIPALLQKNQSMPYVPTSKGVKDFCRNLAKKGIGAAALQDLQDAIDGKKRFATATDLGKYVSYAIAEGIYAAMRPAMMAVGGYAATKAIAGADRDGAMQQKGITMVSDEMKKSLGCNYPRVSSGHVRARAEIFMTQLLYLSHENAISRDTDGFQKLEPELAFWSRAEETLLANGHSKETIVETRARFLTEMKAWKEKGQHMANIVERCIHTNQYIQMSGDECTSLDALINAYKHDKEGDGKSFPSVEEIEGLRNNVAELARQESLQKVDIYQPGFDAVSAESTNAYLETTKRIKDRYEATWKDPSQSSALEKVYESLNGWPKDLVDELRGIEIQILMSVEKKTRFMEDAARDGGNFLRVWRLDAALSEANKISGKAKFTTEDSVRTRDWMSRFLGKAVAHIETTGETTGGVAAS